MKVARMKYVGMAAPSLEFSLSIKYLVALSAFDVLKGINSLESTFRMLTLVLEVFCKFGQKDGLGVLKGTNAQARGLSEILCT